MDMMAEMWNILIFYSSAHIPKELRVWCLYYAADEYLHIELSSDWNSCMAWLSIVN